MLPADGGVSSGEASLPFSHSKAFGYRIEIGRHGSTPSYEIRSRDTPACQINAFFVSSFLTVSFLILPVMLYFFIIGLLI